jgi:putative flippase GtrA
MRFGHVPRYVIVGAFCAGLYNLMMIASDALGVGYLVSTVVAFVILVLIGYALHCLYTFSEKLSWPGLARYTAAMLLTLPLSLGGIYLFRGFLHLPMWIASPLVTISLFCWNFIATRWAVVARVLTGKKSAPEELSP